MKKLFLNLAPITLLVAVVLVSFGVVNSDSPDNRTLLSRPAVPPKVQVESIRTATDLRSSGGQLQGRVAPEAKALVATKAPPVTTESTTPPAAAVETQASVNTEATQTPVDVDTREGDKSVGKPGAESGESGKKEQVWKEINDAIYGLNDVVGDDLFLDVKRIQKGQMEIRLDDGLWKRVRYQTRVDLKTDISNLWHLYVVEYGYAGSSVVYFVDDGDDRVIDIFSKAN